MPRSVVPAVVLCGALSGALSACQLIGGIGDIALGSADGATDSAASGRAEGGHDGATRHDAGGSKSSSRHDAGHSSASSGRHDAAHDGEGDGAADAPGDATQALDADATPDGSPADVNETCFIDSSMFTKGTVNPANPCETCQPQVIATGWSNLADGAGCGNGQTCMGSVCGTGCTIGGSFFTTGTANPGNPCESCQPGTSTTTWANVATGSSCGAGEICNNGLCTSNCFIGGTVYMPDAANPTNACQSCTVGASTSSWTNIADGASCGMGMVCTAGVCGSCPTASPTVISGQVMDPGMNVPLSNVAVYIATAPPVAFTDEPANVTPGAAPTCDTCAALSSPGSASGVATDVNGMFTLPVIPGTYTVVAQIGRWRRVATNVTASACSNTVIPSEEIRMPTSRAEGDIPKMAVVSGHEESPACFLVKVGIATSEFAPYAAGSPNRVQLYDTENSGGNGEHYWTGISAVQPPSATMLWPSGGDPGTLSDYSAVVFGCDGEDGITGTAVAQTAMVNYANSGGRLFFDHLPGKTWIELGTSAAPAIAGSAWSGTTIATWNASAASPGAGVLAEGTVESTTPDEQAMEAWLGVWDTVPYGAGFIQSDTPRFNAVAVGADAVELVAFTTPMPAVGSFLFDTPTTASVGSYCGRVVYNDMHASPTRSSNLAGGSAPATTFPGSCSAAPLTSEELALEYELFAMFGCNIGGTSPL